MVDDQGQTTAALFVAPAGSLVAGARATEGRAEDQHAQLAAVGAADDIPELLARGADVAQIMMLREPPSGAGFGWGAR